MRQSSSLSRGSERGTFLTRTANMNLEERNRVFLVIHYTGNSRRDRSTNVLWLFSFLHRHHHHLPHTFCSLEFPHSFSSFLGIPVDLRYEHESKRKREREIARFNRTDHHLDSSRMIGAPIYSNHVSVYRRLSSWQ